MNAVRLTRKVHSASRKHFDRSEYEFIYWHNRFASKVTHNSWDIMEELPKVLIVSPSKCSLHSDDLAIYSSPESRVDQGCISAQYTQCTTFARKVEGVGVFSSVTRTLAWCHI